MAFNIGLSGLNAAAKSLEVTGNNISNVATTGFKESRAEFKDVFNASALGVPRNASGSGVMVADIAQQFKQGNIDLTGNGLDLAVSGEGFFVLDDNGERMYTRAGAFQLESGVDAAGDPTRYVVNNQNQRLQVYGLVLGANGDQFTEPFNFNVGPGGLQDLQIPTGDSPARATTSATATINLDSTEALPPISGAFDPDDPNTYNHQTSFTVYDSLGTAHTTTLYFEKLAGANEWDVHLTVDGVGTPGPPFELTPFNPDGTLNFNSDGTLNFDPTAVPPDGISGISTVTIPGADLNSGGLVLPDDLEFDINFRELTQFASPFTVNRLAQDGFTSGRLANVEVDASGIVFAQYTNGRSAALGQVALAAFDNPQGLRQLGGAWAVSSASGAATLGQADTGRFGEIQAGALEASTVELTEQLVNLITSQRNFQANAQVISAADTITQTVINIR